MRRCLLALIVIVAMAGGIGTAAVALVVKDDTKRSIVYNPCDEKPKPKDCDVKF